MSFSASDVPPQPRHQHRWIWFTLGGCGTLVVLAIAAIVIFGVVIAHNLNPTGACLPSGFPVAPNLTKVTTLHLGSTCTTAYRTDDSTSEVQTFYASALNQGGWEVTSQSGSRIQFQMTHRTQEAGTVTVSAARRGGTSVAVVLRNP